MKKSLIYSLVMCVAMLTSLAACNDDDTLVFDHELPQFELRDDAILLEVIMPSNTGVDDKIYIVGAFNGGEENAVGNPMWQLEKAENNNVKWGIYLYPENFAEGTSLADGFYFYNATQGVERTLKNEDVMRFDNPAVGTRTDLVVSRWKAYFDAQKDPNDIQHDGYVIYVVDQTGWDGLAMYAWGDAEAFGGWPGMTPTGNVTKDGVTFKYFDTTEANAGLNLNLIFNNNGGGSQLADYNVTLDKDYYLLITADGVSEYDPSQSVEHDGFAVFVSDMTGWDGLAMYMWGDVNDLNGGWPGMEPTGTQTINGVTYYYFDFGEANTGLNENLIFNNAGGGSQLGDFNFTIERDLYVEITASGVTEIDPETYKPGGVITPPDEPDPKTTTYYIYAENTTDWSPMYLYAWGDKEYFGGWPGKLPDGETKIAGITFSYWVVEGNIEKPQEENLIFNNGVGGEGGQTDSYPVVFNQNYFLSVNPATVVVKKPRK